MGFPPTTASQTVISRLNPEAFQACFRNWTRTVAEMTDREFIAIDGKTARGSSDRRRANVSEDNR